MKIWEEWIIEARYVDVQRRIII